MTDPNGPDSCPECDEPVNRIRGTCDYCGWDRWGVNE
jgi:hypothetical protein